ncbi:MAG TPA: anthranilate synthase component I family protein, partial [Bacteroidia bacterium]|nr:anthranilate synthase component I family protein [Bacteroidia bacterium]
PHKGKLYVLGEERGFCTNAFVLIPYQNPSVSTPTPRYFPIEDVKEIELEQAEVNSGHINIRARYSKKHYLEKVQAIKTHIQFGNIYEINFCMDFFAENSPLDPLGTFLKLQQRAKAPYAALVKIGPEYILCASPELFLKKTGHTLITKPIKGTAPRGQTSEDDLKFKTTLQYSAKERTENVMAVDVARNDLSVFASRASVKVDKLFGIESFETVHQMVSTISCTVPEDVSFEQIIKATFPMASMTGAPKQMAMNLIDEFEDFERQYYSGSFGLLDKEGDFELNVVIRSMFYNSKTKNLHFAVGGAITYLSDPEEEYQECLLKAKGLLHVLSTSHDFHN